MPISYKSTNGTAIRHCVITSGGVRIADKINIQTIAYFLLLDKNPGVTMPIFVRKRITKGTWKTALKANVNIPIKEIYLLMVIMGVILSVAKFKRKFIAMGTITR